MPDNETRKSACILCYVNCGIEVEIEDGRMKRVKGDKENPKSLGYICQKAGRLPFYANDRALRLTKPLRRNAAGGFDLYPHSLYWGTRRMVEALTRDRTCMQQAVALFATMKSPAP